MKKPKIFIIPVMSKIHKEKILKPFKKIKKIFGKDVEVLSFEKPLSSIDEFSQLKIEDADATVVFVCGGGTSQLVAKIASNKDWFILAYPENNSLPSALSAKEKMVSAKTWKGKLVYTDMLQPPKKIVDAAYASRMLKLVKNTKIGLFGEKNEKLMEKINFVEEYFQVKSTVYPFEKLNSVWEAIPYKEAEKRLSDKLLRRFVVKVSRKDLVEAFRLYLALKDIVKTEKFDYVTMDCFKYLNLKGITPCLAFSLLNDEGFFGICENEVVHAPLMFMLTNLTNQPCWIANTTTIKLKKNSVILAHCTAATKLLDKKKKVIIKNHFESSLSVSLDVPLMRKNVTLVHLAFKPPKMVIVEGKILKTQLNLKNLCRTQALIKLKCNLKDFLRETGNHQVLCYGNYASVLASIGKNIGIDVVWLKEK